MSSVQRIASNEANNQASCGGSGRKKTHGAGA
jgi:hypothetical protein